MCYNYVMKAKEALRKVDEYFPPEAQLAFGELAMAATGVVVAFVGVFEMPHDTLMGLTDWVAGGETVVFAGKSAINHLKITAEKLANRI